MFKVLRERKDRKMIKKSFKDLKKREKETSRRMAQLDTSLKLFRKAHKLEKQGKLDKAIALYKKNLQLYGKTFHNSDHYRRLAIVLERMRRYEEALDICEEALSLPVEHWKTRGRVSM